jgi:hypothetical protein
MVLRRHSGPRYAGTLHPGLFPLRARPASLSTARCPVPVYGLVPEASLLWQLLLYLGLCHTAMPPQEHLAVLVEPMLDHLREAGITIAADPALVVTSTVETDGKTRSLFSVTLYQG